MDRKSVTSSNIKSVGYDPVEKHLDVEFVGGGVYRYSGVPKTVYDDWMSAESIGSFFQKKIRNEYAVKRLEADEE